MLLVFGGDDVKVVGVDTEERMLPIWVLMTLIRPVSQTEKPQPENARCVPCYEDVYRPDVDVDEYADTEDGRFVERIDR